MGVFFFEYNLYLIQVSIKREKLLPNSAKLRSDTKFSLESCKDYEFSLNPKNTETYFI